MPSNVLFPTQREKENQQWLEDAAIRMVCVFALDRFADFVSDQVRKSTNTYSTCTVHCAGVVEELSTKIMIRLTFNYSKTLTV